VANSLALWRPHSFAGPSTVFTRLKSPCQTRTVGSLRTGGEALAGLDGDEVLGTDGGAATQPLITAMAIATTTNLCIERSSRWFLRIDLEAGGPAVPLSCCARSLARLPEKHRSRRAPTRHRHGGTRLSAPLRLPSPAHGPRASRTRLVIIIRLPGDEIDCPCGTWRATPSRRERGAPVQLTRHGRHVDAKEGVVTSTIKWHELP